jgi:hypothetical protein
MNFDLPQKYVNLGFRMSKFGEKSLALKCEDRIVFVFGPGSEVRESFVSRICDCHLKLASSARVLSRY